MIQSTGVLGKFYRKLIIILAKVKILHNMSLN